MSTSVKSQTFEYSVMIFDGQNDTVWSSLTVSIDRISCARAGLYTKKSNWCRPFGGGWSKMNPQYSSNPVISSRMIDIHRTPK